jgi:hypothetical protein
LIPLILVDLTQGTFDLSQNKELKLLFNQKDNPLHLIIIFTKVCNAFEQSTNELSTRDPEFENLDFE